MDHVGKTDRSEILALGFHHQTDDRALLDIEHPLLDKILVHHRVEEAVVDDVVDVAVDVVVTPARGDSLVVAVGIAWLR